MSLEVDGNYAKLVLDRVHAASGTAPGTLRTLNLDNSIYFGGHMRQHASTRHGRSLPVTNGFRGCMEAINLNGQELPLNTKAHRTYAVLEDIVDVAPGCALAPVDTCSSNPCTNGGSCTSLPNGGTSCPAWFYFPHLGLKFIILFLIFYIFLYFLPLVRSRCRCFFGYKKVYLNELKLFVPSWCMYLQFLFYFLDASSPLKPL